MHRDYSHYSGYVAIVVFDDRIEIRSYGRLPNGITVEQLSGRHDSKPVNPLIAGAFHRTGAVEVWGRGTNRVIAMCKKHGAAPPSFEDRNGFLIVTFKAQMVVGGDTAVSEDPSRLESRLESRLAARVILMLQNGESGKAGLARGLGHATVSGELHKQIRLLLDQSLIEMTIPDKPNSRLQKYRLTAKGQAVLEKSA